MNDRRPGFVIFFLGDPHLLESGEGGQDGASDPDGVFPLGRSDDLDLHAGRSQGGGLLLHAISDTGEHGGTAGQDRIGEQFFSNRGFRDVDVAL